jgi:hypothetical protein
MGRSKVSFVSPNELFRPWRSGYPTLALGVLGGWLFRIGVNRHGAINAKLRTGQLGKGKECVNSP